MLPWTLTMPLNHEMQVLAPSLLAGQPVDARLHLALIAIEALIFITVSLWRFEKEEF